MAVVNQYKFKGINNDTTGNALNIFGSGNPLVSETYIIKSLKVGILAPPIVYDSIYPSSVIILPFMSFFI